ncbi:uncharacterized protein G2W53_003183 [Senna tora]|uniref:Uncharacterized protein n=1 Tax=Senna tora TaxID=362788 RepID=A0A835CI69_9FABA|nr:uncharacterized protein G2W53_003183 [Senna tora]
MNLLNLEVMNLDIVHVTLLEITAIPVGEELAPIVLSAPVFSEESMKFTHVMTNFLVVRKSDYLSVMLIVVMIPASLCLPTPRAKSGNGHAG